MHWRKPAFQCVFALLAISTVSSASFEWHAGALLSGNDLGTGNFTTDGAIAHCKLLPSCSGFTYHVANKNVTNATKVYFKSTVSMNTDSTWSNYISMAPKLLAQSFQSNMVVQHDRPCFWGILPESPATKVNITAKSGSKVVSAAARTDNAGNFRVCLAAQDPSNDAYTITVVVGAQDQVLVNVLFGDVWVASGQSNMAFSTKQAFNASLECAAANIPGLRLFTVAVHQSNVSLPDFEASGIRQQWAVSSPDSVCGGGDFDYFSAVAFFFGRDLQAALGTPVGIIATSVPGSRHFVECMVCSVWCVVYGV
jgi:hypothetical protein